MRWKVQFASIILGAVSVLAFAPFDFPLVVFVCLSGLFYLSKDRSPRQAFRYGFFFGLGQYLFGVSWVYVSLATYGGMPFWMGSVAVLGFAAIMALFVALTNYLANVLAKGDFNRYLVLLPFSWAVFEWSKSWVLSGFPWLDIGYTQTQTWLFSWAPLGGLYLVTFLTVALSCALVYIFLSRSIVVMSLILSLVLGSFFINRVAWTSPDGEPTRIGIVQANIAIEGKWSNENQSRAISKYQTLSAKLADSSKSSLIVWPETALPLYATQTDRAFWQTVAPDGVNILTGLLDYDGVNSYNSAALNCFSDRSNPQLYRKRHLVPFGEYQPLAFLFSWVFEYLQLPMSDFKGWQGAQSLQCENGVKIGLSICYEDAFSNEYREHLADASILVNISEDAWFGDSFAPHQRRQMAQMRARELGRPMVRAANSGPSLFVNEFGQVMRSTQQFVEAIDSFDIQPMKGRTPFMAFGSWIVWLSILVLLVFSVRRVIDYRLARQ